MTRTARAIWKHVRRRHAWPLCDVVLLLLVTIAGGCGKEPGPVCHPVRGQVTYDGKPLPEAQIVFHRQGDWPPGSPRPIARADGQGSFAMTTWHTGDGAPVGNYAVTIELREPRLRGEETIRDGRNLLPSRYARPTTSDLRCEVLEREENVVQLALKSR